MLINYVDSLKVWGLRPHTPPLTTSGDLRRLKTVRADLDIASNKIDRYREFQDALLKSDLKQEMLLRYKTAGEFISLMYSLPFSEKKRIVDAIVAPENGGRCKIRYIRPEDFLEGEELRDVPKAEWDKPLTDGEPCVYADLRVDLDKIRSVINSLDRFDLLNKESSRSVPRRQEDARRWRGLLRKQF